LAATRGTPSSLAARYATALFELAEERDALDAVAADLAQVREAFEAPDVKRLVRSPVVERAVLESAVEALADRLGLGGIVRNTLRVLARGRRLFLVPLIARQYEERLAERRGEARAEVVSALPLTDDQRRRLVEALEAGIGRRIRLESRVDPSLLGGLVVQIGSRMIDASLKHKLQQLELAMKGVA